VVYNGWFNVCVLKNKRENIITKSLEELPVAAHSTLLSNSI